jgi:hypothetical protein
MGTKRIGNPTYQDKTYRRTKHIGKHQYWGGQGTESWTKIIFNIHVFYDTYTVSHIQYLKGL